MEGRHDVIVCILEVGLTAELEEELHHSSEEKHAGTSCGHGSGHDADAHFSETIFDSQGSRFL